MDHDLLMMIYGALIGVGSSIITTLFQSWISRRERERQRREEQKREQQKIQIPTAAEVKAIKNGTYEGIPMLVIPTMLPKLIELLKSKELLILVRALIVLLICGILYLIYRIDSPALYLIASGLFVFSIFYAGIKRTASTELVNIMLILLSSSMLLWQSQILPATPIDFQSRISLILSVFFFSASIIIGCYIAWIRFLDIRMMPDTMQVPVSQEMIKTLKEAQKLGQVAEKLLPIQLFVCAIGFFFVALEIIYDLF